MSPQDAWMASNMKVAPTHSELTERLKMGIASNNRLGEGNAFPNRVNAYNIITTANNIKQEARCRVPDSSPAAALIVDEQAMPLLCVNQKGSTIALSVEDALGKRPICEIARGERVDGCGV